MDAQKTSSQSPDLSAGFSSRPRGELQIIFPLESGDGLCLSAPKIAQLMQSFTSRMTKASAV